MQKNEYSFDESLTFLEKIVGDLERGDLSLEDGLEKFEKGIEAYKICNKILSDAQKRVTILTESLTEESFVESDR